jgi:hypothetical protein
MARKKAEAPQKKNRIRRRTKFLEVFVLAAVTGEGEECQNQKKKSH